MSAAAEYRAALERETAVREQVFLGITEKVGPFELRQFTVRDFMALGAVGSPFIMGGFPEPSDVWELLWFQSVEPRTRYRRWRFIRRLIHYPDYNALMSATRAYVADAFMDLGGGSSKGSRKSYYSWCASIIDALASEYGWNAKDIIELPLKEVGQYIRAIRRRHDSKAILFNESDALQTKAVREKANANSSRN